MDSEGRVEEIKKNQYERISFSRSSLWPPSTFPVNISKSLQRYLNLFLPLSPPSVYVRGTLSMLLRIESMLQTSMPATVYSWDGDWKVRAFHKQPSVCFQGKLVSLTSFETTSSSYVYVWADQPKRPRWIFHCPRVYDRLAGNGGKCSISFIRFFFFLSIPG